MLSLASLVAACGARTALHDPADASPGASVDYTAECAAAHGTPDPYSDATGLAARLTGRWFCCDYGKGPDLYQRNQGIELDLTSSAPVSGTWSALAVASDGTATPLTGPDDHGTWAPQAQGTYVDVTAASGGDTISAFDFETNPRRMHVVVATEGADSWFVPLTP